MNIFMNIWMSVILLLAAITNIIRLVSLFSKSSFFQKKWVLKITEVKKSNLVIYYLLALGVCLYGLNWYLEKIL